MSVPKTKNVFYGWWIVGACFIVWILIGGFVFGFTAFIEPIANKFGWSYAQISLAVSLQAAEAGIVAPLMGLIIDRLGPRRIMFGGAILVGLGLFLLSRVTSLGMFYAAFILVAIGVSGLSPTVIMTAVANWFRKKVGIAIGIVACGFALGSLIVPVIVKLINVFDWQATFFIMAMSILIIVLPLSLLIRHKPEKYGYLPDGEQSSTVIPDEVPGILQTSETDIGVKQAVKSRTFWHIGLAMTFQFLATNAVVTHVMPYLSSVDIARSTSSLVAMALPIASIIGRLGSGWLGDRYSRKRVATGCIAIMGLGLLFFSYVSNEGLWLLVPFIILFGIGWGGSATIRAALVSEYFGRARFGTILGFMMGMIALGGIAGPFFAGWVFDNWGSYHIAWLTFGCLAFAALITVATTPRVGMPVKLYDKKSLSQDTY